MNQKKCVLVTGATGVLGSALVAALREANCEVVANYCHDEKRAALLAQKTGCQLARGDVSIENSVETLFQTRFDAVYHLAGASHDALLPRVSTQNWSFQLQTNLQSAFLVTRAALSNLPRDGKLILVASRVAERGFVGQSAYGASKAAIFGLMKTAALEGREKKIAVNAVCPGFAISALSESLSPAILARRSAENLIPDADAPQSFAALCLWLLNSNTSGQVLRPDCRI
jgi:3-oxoacyl-[acyl-carrier protein] reductase